MTHIKHFDSLEEALVSLRGSGTGIKRADRVAGGDINEAYKLTLADGTFLFMKANARVEESFFAAEAAGLSAIAQTGAIGTPHVFGCGTDNGCGTDKKNGGRPFLLMEFIESGKRIPDYWEVFGRQFAAMHKAGTESFTRGGKYGFLYTNFIGSRDQDNTAHDNWIAFFRDCRLKPQFQSAARYFSPGEQKKAAALLEKLEEVLVEPEYPSLLHGDLWSGNAITGSDGRAWLIDPAVYVGSAEADLAMTELFGGFPRPFYEAYREAAPLQPGYEQRRDLYNLYHLLNHLNLFGRSYLPSVKRVIDQYI